MTALMAAPAVESWASDSGGHGYCAVRWWPLIGSRARLGSLFFKQTAASFSFFFSLFSPPV
jgi:hypothetical protein